jgi:hypothetical protein
MEGWLAWLRSDPKSEEALKDLERVGKLVGCVAGRDCSFGREGCGADGVVWTFGGCKGACCSCVGGGEGECSV